jgi:hypothetical protein
VSERRSAKVSAYSAAVAESRITEEPEPSWDQEREQKFEGDTNSTISGGSIVFRDPGEKNMVIQSFTDAILKDLPN